MHQKKTACILIVILFFSAGCASVPLKVKNPYRSHDFNSIQLSKGKVGILGVFTHDKKAGLLKSDRLNAQLYSVFKEKRPELPIFSSNVTGAFLAKYDPEILVRACRRDDSTLLGFPGKNDVENIPFRFLLLGIVEKNLISKSRHEELKREPDTKIPEPGYKNKKPKEEVWIRRTTTRTLKITIAVLDINSWKVVWKGTLQDTGSNSRSYKGVAGEDLFQQPIAFFGNTLFDAAAGPFLQPKAPSEEKMARKIFLSFALQIR